MPATYEPIATISGQSLPYTFSSIPQTYTDLRLVLTNSAGSPNYQLRFNSDTGTNYGSTFLSSDGATLTVSKLNASNSINVIYTTYSGQNAPGVCVVDIFSYANTGVFKSCLSRSANDAGFGLTGYGYTGALVNSWASTAAITSINIVGGGSIQTATLYGILRA